MGQGSWQGSPPHASLGLCCCSPSCHTWGCSTTAWCCSSLNHGQVVPSCSQTEGWICQVYMAAAAGSNLDEDEESFIQLQQFLHSNVMVGNTCNGATLVEATAPRGLANGVARLTSPASLTDPLKMLSKSKWDVTALRVEVAHRTVAMD